MNASVGNRAQAQNRTTPNIRPLQPLSLRFPSIKAGLDFEIQRQPQNSQPTMHAPIAREREPLDLTLPTDLDEPGPVLPEERQQATLQAPAPGPEGQRASVTARQQHQDPQPTEVPVPNAPEPATRNRPIQRQRSHAQRNRAYSPEQRYGPDPPADIEIPADNRGIAYYLPNIAPRIHATLNAAGPWIYDIATWIFDVLWAVSIIIMTLAPVAWWFRYQLVGLYVCPSVNAFCEVRYNPMCVEYLYPNTRGTTAAPLAPLLGEVVPKGDRNIKQEDSEYIQSLSRIPHALDEASKRYDCYPSCPFLSFSTPSTPFPRETFRLSPPLSLPDSQPHNAANPLFSPLSLKEQLLSIQMSSMPDKKKKGLIKYFNWNYFHDIGIIHRHIRRFESVSKTIDDAGWWEGVYAFVRRTTLWLVMKEAEEEEDKK